MSSDPQEHEPGKEIDDAENNTKEPTMKSKNIEIKLPIVNSREFKINSREFRKKPMFAPAEVMYKPAKRLRKFPELSVLRAAGPDREQVKDEREHFNQYRPAPMGHSYLKPDFSDSRRSRPWKPLTWLQYPPPIEDRWKKREDKCKDMRDHGMALKLGYETLVGNLQYLKIPGAKDLDRSWQNFLSSDEMEWGFPYEKGTIEKPRVYVPEPYLAHQVKERLWKYPRTRIFHNQASEES